MHLSRVFGLLVVVALTLSTQVSFAVDPWGLKAGAVELKSAGPLAFGPEGILFVGDPVGASVVAVATDDAKAASAKSLVNIPNFLQKLADTLGAGVDQTRVVDLAVNPVSRNIYVSVASGQPAQPALVRISTDGKLSKVALDNVRHARATLSDVPDPNQATGRRRGDPRRNDYRSDLRRRPSVCVRSRECPVEVIRSRADVPVFRSHNGNQYRNLSRGARPS